MAHLIDKDALVAEIKRLLAFYSKEIEDNKKDPWSMDIAKRDILQEILSFLDTLEVKEVDLEDSVKEVLAQKYINYTFRRHNIDPESKEGQLIYYAYMHGMNQCLNQLKAQKEEEV